MIRNLRPNDFNMWSNLYKAYAEFYKVPMNNEILDTLWGWIQDKNHNAGISPSIEPIIFLYLNY